MAYLAEVAAASGEVVTRAQLEAFRYRGEQLKLIDQSRGIRNPRQLSATLSILSQTKGPHDDVETEDRLWWYACRDGSPDTGDRKLRRPAELGLPLVRQGIAAGVFVPTFPVVADDTRSDATSRAPWTRTCASSPAACQLLAPASTPSG